MLLLFKHLDSARWQLHLACNGGPLVNRAAALGVAVHTVPMGRLRRSTHALLDWLAGTWAVAHRVREIGAVLLIANTVRTALYAAPAARLARVPFVWHMRDFWLSEARPHRLWADKLGKQLLCASATRVIANSYATAAHLPCRSKVVVIHNGIEVERFDPALNGRLSREQHGIPTSAPLVGTVGRLRPWKGQDCFLRALARVRQAIPNVWGLIVGGSPFGVQDDYPTRLRRVAADLGLNDCVAFTGQLPDPRSAMAAMDLFVHPGDPEPFGLVNLEAMAMGKPIVAFAHGALPEIVADGETGLLIPSGGETGLAEAVITLLGDPARRARMGQAGRTRVVRHFAAQCVAREVETTLQEIMAR
jgi:glycosyltransferase involved in cell wall biosynthesis